MMRPTQWAVVGLVAAGTGAAAAVTGQGWVTGVLLIAFIVLGPGAALRAFIPLSPALTALVVPLVGVAVWMLVATGMAMLDAWSSRFGLFGLAAITGGVALTRLLLARSPVPPPSAAGEAEVNAR